ncbi:MAG: hypothetical protein C0434_06255 [Xanthomonadaceae bacterium]|nr:hypothetical protein [Xanthomonadaceae bacterium]
MLLMLAIGGAVPGAVRAAAVYKWVDRDGSVHYDDQHRLEQRLTWDYLNGRQVPARPDATTPPAFVAAVAADCRLARERAEVVRAASVIYGSDPVGNVYQLSPRQQLLELKMAERDATRYCAPGAAERLYRELRAERERRQQKPAPIVVEQRGP